MVKIIRKERKLIDNFFSEEKGIELFKCRHCMKTFRRDYLANIHIINRHPELKKHVKKHDFGFWLGGLLKP